MKFQSVEALQQVVNVVNEAAAALDDPKRTIRESAIPEVLAGTVGAGIGGTISFAALYGLGTVGLNAPVITSALSSQYDFLCFVQDSKIGGISAVLSILINMVISLLHGLYYDEGSDGNRDLFEVRTRKILLYSNTLASTGNIAATLITKNAKMLDIGGLLVTISRLYTDARFIARAKEVPDIPGPQREVVKRWCATPELFAIL